MKKKVLFLCAGNSCNSQMAEGLMRQFYSDKYEVFSAGVSPLKINKNAIEVMKEIGVDISNQATKHFNEFLNQPFDIIITVGDNVQETVPSFWSAAEKQDWQLFDPAEKLDTQKDLIPALREVRDQITEKIHENFAKR